MIDENEYSPSSRIDLLIKIINRYDTYITSTNAKASLVIAWNGVVIGSIILKCREIVEQFSSTCTASWLITPSLIICGFLALASNWLIFSVVFPFLTASRDDRGSLIFFGSVAKTEPQEYSKAIQSVSAVDLIEDLAHQASTLAVGLNNKMRRLQWSIRCLCGQLVMIGLLLILFAYKI